MKSAIYQRGFGLTGYLAVGSAVAILSITVLWQMERVKTASLEGEIKGLHGEMDILQGNNEQLKSTLKDSQRTVEAFAELGNKQADRAQELTSQLYDTQAESYQRQNDINQLRATETKRSLQDPYGTGNAAHDRLLSGLLGISGKTGRDHQNGDGPETNKTDTPANAGGSANSTGAGD